MRHRNNNEQGIREIRVRSVSWWRYLVSLSIVGLGFFSGYVALTGKLPSLPKFPQDFFTKVAKEEKDRPAPKVAKASRRTGATKPSKSENQSWKLETVLTQVKQRSEEITPSEANSINEMLRKLRQQGVAALPTIRAFLRKKGDVDFSQLGGKEFVEYRTLRLALLDLVNHIGGSDALALSLEQFRDTQDPAEIALLARNLEKQAPGVYRDEIVRTASEMLQQEQQVAPEEQSDVGPLFDVLQSYSGGDVVNNLEQATPRWWEYSLIALAGLPKGEGLPSLLARAGDTNVPVQYKSSLPFQLLAQAATQYPEAGETLIELTRLGQIPDRAWQGVGEALEGKHLQFASPFSQDSVLAKDRNSPSGQLPLTREYTLERTNIHYEQRAASTLWSTEQIQQQVTLIDDLLKATSKNPEAVKALQRARDVLQSEQRLGMR